MLISHPAGAAIRIGRSCAISHNVQIRTEGYRTDIPFIDARNEPGEWADITIGDAVWLGANVFVCGGVVIGSNSIVGANSVVTRDVPSNAIVGGVPARVIRYKLPEPGK
jgi:maltose O-acetyltransferase